MNIPLVKNPFVLSKIIEGKKVLLNADDGILLQLDCVAAVLWEMVDGHKDGITLARGLTERFDVSPDESYTDTKKVLEMFWKDEFIDYQ